jgi:hypothetical protein
MVAKEKREQPIRKGILYFPRETTLGLMLLPAIMVNCFFLKYQRLANKARAEVMTRKMDKEDAI